MKGKIDETGRKVKGRIEHEIRRDELSLVIADLGLEALEITLRFSEGVAAEFL